jgi:dTMP kinase
MPDMTIYFDIPAEVGLDRIMANEKREINRLDLESLKFHKKVCKGYKKIIEKDRERFKIVDATKPIEEVYSAVLYNIKKELNLLE